jgi:hypothetical protein
MKKEYSIDYNVLKSNIIKSTKYYKDSVAFSVNFEKLSNLSEDIGLTLINIGLGSKPITPDSIPVLSEYFKDQKLSWISKDKDYTILTFIESDSIDNRANELIEEINECKSEDEVSAISELIANYPVRFAAIISYNSTDPESDRFKKVTYTISCRANKIAITKENYKYNQNDI